ncbi:MAG: TetR/AcrR family transcriptional regulator [Gammaproteobacteria bacterium]
MEHTQNEAKTRKLRRKDERPNEILKAALEVFTTHGYAATRIDDVAERAGVAKGTIYLYFPSKEELFAEVVRHAILPHFETIEAYAEKGGSAEEILRMQLQTIYSKLVSTEVRYIPRLIIGEGTRFPELTEFYYQEIISRCHRTLLAVIRRGVESGEFRAAALTWQPQAILSPALSAAIWLLLFDKYAPLDLDAYFRTHVDLLMHGLKA